MVEAGFNYGDSQVTPNQFTSESTIQAQAWGALTALSSEINKKVPQEVPDGMARAEDLLAPQPRRSGKEVANDVIAAVLDVNDTQDPAKLDALRKALGEYKTAEKAAQSDEDLAKLLGYSRNKGIQVSQNEDGSFSIVIGNGERGTTNHLITVPKEGKISVSSKVNGAFVPGYASGGNLSEAQEALKISSKEKK